MPDLNRLAASVRPAPRAGTFPGLPVVQRAVTARAPRIGATVTDTTAAPDAPVEVANLPSVKIEPLPWGGVAARISFKTRYAPMVGADGFGPMHDMGNTLVRDAQRGSRGPYTLRMLAAANHPYGRDGAKARPVPRRLKGRSIGQAKGVKGSLPTLTVTNWQTGTFARSWEYAVEKTRDGADLLLINAAPHAIFPILGTRKMQAHSPATYVVATNRGAMLGAWQKEINSARQVFYKEARRQQAMADNLAQIGRGLGAM